MYSPSLGMQAWLLVTQKYKQHIPTLEAHMQPIEIEIYNVLYRIFAILKHNWSLHKMLPQLCYTYLRLRVQTFKCKGIRERTDISLPFSSFWGEICTCELVIFLKSLILIKFVTVRYPMLGFTSCAYLFKANVVSSDWNSVERGKNILKTCSSFKN
jgi:hypothetical protein